MRKISILILALTIVFALGANAVSAQFPIKIPKLPKTEKPKTEQPKPDDGATSVKETPVKSGQTGAKNSGSKRAYGIWAAPASRTLLKNSIEVQTEEASTYWKMPKQKDYKSWIPTVSFSLCCGAYNLSYELNYSAEFYNPDGSLWFIEKLQSDPSIAADGAIVIRNQGNAAVRQTLETKASVGTGIYAVKVVSDETKETLFQGKFKVGKFLPPNSERTPNAFGFFVDHDWLLPIAYVGFHHSEFRDEDAGGFPILIKSWIKGGDAATGDLEARIFYRDRQVAVAKPGSPTSERASDSAAIAPEPRPIWKFWEFQSEEFLFANGGSFNRDRHPNAHYADENPGEYTVKIFLKNEQIREIKFTIQSNGKLADGNFGNQIYLPRNAIIVPAKVMGAAEKWNATAWKTDAFYGNPLTGFNIP